MTRSQELVGLNPGAVYWMNIFSHWFVVKIVSFVWKSLKIIEKDVGVAPLLLKNAIYGTFMQIASVLSLRPFLFVPFGVFRRRLFGLFIRNCSSRKCVEWPRAASTFFTNISFRQNVVQHIWLKNFHFLLGLSFGGGDCSVTRFGENSQLWQNFKFGAFLFGSV